jgi:hypothetical protein
MTIVTEKISSSQLKAKVINFLKEHIEGSLATCMNNIPRCSPVQYFIGDELDIYIVSAGGDKFNAIAKNPNVCLLVNTDYLDYRKIRGVQIFGRASTSLANSSVYDEAKRYAPANHIINTEKESLKVIKIIPEEIVYLDALHEGDRTKQILKLKENEVITKSDESLRMTNTEIKTYI